MKIRYVAQYSERAKAELAAKGRKLAVTADGATKIYDLSGYTEGEFLSGPDDYLLNVAMKEGELIAFVLYPHGQNATEEERFPEDVLLEDVKKLPRGKEVALSFVKPEESPLSEEQRKLQETEKALLASYEAQADLYERTLSLEEENTSTQLALAELFEAVMGG